MLPGNSQLTNVCLGGIRHLVSRLRGRIIAEHSESVSNDLSELGLPEELALALRRDYGITDIPSLTHRTERHFLQLSRGGMDVAGLRSIILALALQGYALDGNEYIQYFDLVERLPLSDDDYRVLVRGGIRRISQLTRCDRVDIEQLGLSPDTVQAAMSRIDHQGELVLAPLHADRTLADLRRAPSLDDLFAYLGLPPNTPVEHVSRKRLTGLALAIGDEPGAIACHIDAVASLLKGYGVELD